MILIETYLSYLLLVGDPLNLVVLESLLTSLDNGQWYMWASLLKYGTCWSLSLARECSTHPIESFTCSVLQFLSISDGSVCGVVVVPQFGAC